MTAPALTPDATRCPECRAPLTGRGACTQCGLPLTGPHAARLWELDAELLRLDAARAGLQRERSSLLAALRRQTGTPVTPPAQDGRPEPRPEWTPQRVQNALLGLGGLLLAVAALVFAAVTYDRLGAGGRAGVLLVLTAAAVLAVPHALRRGLASTAETLAAVGIVLAGLDAYGLRTLGVGQELPGTVYTAISAAVLAFSAAAWGAHVPVRVPPVAAVLLAQLPVPLLLVEAQVSPASGALVLAALAAADLAVLAALRDHPRPLVPEVTTGCAALVTTTALGVALVAAFGPQPGAGAVALLAVAAVVAGGAALTPDAGPRTLLAAAPVALVALAATAAARPDLTEAQLPLVPAVTALAAVLAVAQLPRDVRTGPALGALAVAAAAVAAVSEQAATGLLGPVVWTADPWSLTATGSARAALGPGVAWAGTFVVPAVLAVAAAVALGAGLVLERLRRGVVAAAALGAAAAALLPVGLDLPWPVGLGVLAVLGAAAVLTPLPARTALPAALAGAAVLLLACAWSLADRTATLVVLPVAAVALGIASVRTRPVAAPAAALAGLLAAGEVAAAGAAAGLAADQVGALLVPAVAVLLLAAGPASSRPTTGPTSSPTPRADRRTGVELAAALTALAAARLASGDAGWLSWTLAGLALVALGGALRPDRRRLALAGGLLLAASSWVRLADAGVDDPEPYVLPLAAAALALGHLRRRAVPGTRSFAAYGPGLTALLLPSLLASYVGSPLWRPLALAVVALAVVLLGARARLQAPLVVGGAVLAVDAVLLLAPYAAALPRWLGLGLAGALLLAVGATYEQRLRDLGGLRERYDALD